MTTTPNHPDDDLLDRERREILERIEQWLETPLLILGFVWLATGGYHAAVTSAHLTQLGFVIGLEALGVGLGAAAFVAFIARTTHPAYTATQLALFTSLTAIPRTFANAATGWLVEAMGWSGFFTLCAMLALPGMLLLFKVAPWSHERAPAT